MFSASALHDPVDDHGAGEDRPTRPSPCSRRRAATGSLQAAPAYRNVIRMCPPLCLSMDGADDVMDRFVRSFAAAASNTCAWKSVTITRRPDAAISQQRFAGCRLLKNTIDPHPSFGIARSPHPAKHSANGMRHPLANRVSCAGVLISQFLHCNIILPRITFTIAISPDEVHGLLPNLEQPICEGAPRWNVCRSSHG
jgi:hypothetical protein